MAFSFHQYDSDKASGRITSVDKSGKDPLVIKVSFGDFDPATGLRDMVFTQTTSLGEVDAQIATLNTCLASLVTLKADIEALP